MNGGPEISDEVWARIEPLLPDRTPRRGGRWRDHRVVVEAICWRVRTGAPWRDLPQEFGPWQTAWHRFNAGASDGTWDQLLVASPGGVPAARPGLGYRYSAMKTLGDLAGPGAAKDIFFTARRIDANEAKSIGLISRVCEPDQLPALLAEYTTALAANAPLTAKAGKAIMGEVLKPSPDIDMARCQQLIRDCFQSEDYAEGRRAFMEKRKPVFKGK